jgi:hypothetical protein
MHLLGTSLARPRELVDARGWHVDCHKTGKFALQKRATVIFSAMAAPARPTTKSDCTFLDLCFPFSTCVSGKRVDCYAWGYQDHEYLLM